MGVNDTNDHLGERWISPDTGRAHAITRCYLDDAFIDEQTGEVYVWIEFGTPALTYIYKELPERGWTQT